MSSIIEKLRGLIAANKNRKIVENLDTDQEKKEKLLFQISDILNNLKNIKQEVSEKHLKNIEKIKQKYGSESFIAKTLSMKSLYNKVANNNEANKEIHLNDVLLSDIESESDTVSQVK